MNIYTFIIIVMVLFCISLRLMLALAKCDNIKQLDVRLDAKNGFEIKSLFYKKQ